MATYTTPAIRKVTNEYFSHSAKSLRAGDFFDALNPFRFATYLWHISYILTQAFIILYSNCRLFEQGPESSLGGIWSHVNSTSGLQLNSLLYRFHPAVMWTKAFPLRDEIIGETKVTSAKRMTNSSGWEDDPERSRWIINDNESEIFDAIIVNIGTCGDPNWIKLPGMPDNAGKKYSTGSSLEDKGSKEGESPSQDNPQVSASDREWPPYQKNHTQSKDKDEDEFTKLIVHSSELDSPSFKLQGGERVVVIGSGASGVEAVETVLQKFGSIKDSKKGSGGKQGVEVSMIARNDKWIIPRNIIIDTSIAGQPFGRQMPLSFLWEGFLRYWQYSGIQELVPKNLGIYESTPVVNDEFLEHVRRGHCKYIRGQPARLTKAGVIVEARKDKAEASKFGRASKKPSKETNAMQEIEAGEEKLIEADVIVLATGYKKPTIDFLPQDLFPEGYQRPDLYLQNFSTEDWSVLMTNSAYMNAIGTVHIGIYTRILLTLLLDQNARPSRKDMKLWVDVLRFIKKGATGGALGFFTYMELTIWLIGFHLFRPDRIRWLFFIMNGWGVYVQE
ncbi:FAD/NAD-P-binding domain-containing protein [Pholiota molesta]|nr:FAD/NAD-P-binding domain-containing protein [Pholiota molesta]